MSQHEYTIEFRIFHVDPAVEKRRNVQVIEEFRTWSRWGSDLVKGSMGNGRNVYGLGTSTKRGAACTVVFGNDTAVQALPIFLPV